MSVTDLQRQIKIMFTNVPRRRSYSMPEISSLSIELSKIVQRTTADVEPITSGLISAFATAAIEMWHRSIHSFLISVSLTRTSILWTSVAGYYSSHYVIRAFAHLLGVFNLYKCKRIVQIDVSGRVCHIRKKKGKDKEHKFYWTVVKSDPAFKDDPFFTSNDETARYSDSGHRNMVNYADHLGRFADFHVLDGEYVRERIKKIAEIEISAPPIPDTDSYPDIGNVQLVAYHRIVKFRNFLDDILEGANRYWSHHRKPDWCSSFLDFQITEPTGVDTYRDHV